MSARLRKFGWAWCMQTSRLRAVAVGCLMAIGLSACGAVTAVTDMVLPLDPEWERWAAHQPYSDLRVNHRPWNQFLQTYAHDGEDGITRLGYRDVTPAHRQDLDDYIEALSVLQVTRLTRAEQLAYWINLYNALTVQLVLEHYPLESIRQVTFNRSFVPSFLVGDGPWAEELVVVEGIPLSLDNIEHRILRPIFRDPRISYAMNRAALGSPNLQRQSFDPRRADQQLNDAARAFVNHPRGVRIDGNRAGVSSIYTWFRDDFGGSEEAVLVHLRSHADAGLLARLQGVTQVRDQGFDWTLNDTP